VVPYLGGAPVMNLLSRNGEMGLEWTKNMAEVGDEEYNLASIGSVPLQRPW